MAAVNRPSPAHPGPNGRNLHSRPNSGILNSGQQNPGLHGTSQDPGPSSHPQQHVSARPVFYVPAPPPPPFLHYQWPMPFSYNPFAGFPGMGYGMVMPPFPPPPYMEAPAYILPYPHIQPVDYRRLLHPQVHAPSAPYQNPNQTRRIRLAHTFPIRETVNSEVQTEPTQRGIGDYGEGSPLISSDSGHGTTSPSSSSSSSQIQGSAEVENYTLPTSNANDLQVNRTCTSSAVKHGFNIPLPTGTKTVKSFIRATLETQKSCKDSVGQETVPPCSNGQCSMWSVSSPGSMVPVCSSSQEEDDVVKERCVSVPDILMSRGDGMPQETMLKMADKVLPQNDHQLLSYKTEVEHEKAVDQNPNETKNASVVADANDDAEGILSSEDSETLSKILKLRVAHEEQKAESRRENEPVGLVGSLRHCLPYRDDLLHSLSKSHKLPDNEQGNGNETNPHEDTTEIIPYQMSLNGCQMTRKNESVWSVESLAPFIPTKEWLLQNSMYEPEVIVEMTEEAENCRLSTQNDDLIVKASRERRQTRRFSSSDSIPMSDSWLIFSTPAGKQSPSKKPEMESENDASEIRGPSEKDPVASQTHLPSKLFLSNSTEEDVDENRSSEPEAIQSPNQESLIVNEQEKSPGSPEQQETLLLNSAAGEKISSMGQLILQNGVDMEAEDGACGNKASQLRNEQLCVPMADQKMAEVSPSKGHLVDCGIQCTELQELKCVCELKSSMGPSRKRPFKYSDMKKANHGKAKGFCMNGHMQKNQKRPCQWRNRGQEKQSSHQEDDNGYYGKPGKSKGGNGRNPRY
ncbi:uncharacterized protein LOC122887138 [Siniperca chuatsi]|uniref:uncharacterized protein LOC122887138 n=1 Tax=Siniperca chuatsi TaxID=119488 RepID=UPI001CE11A54|nr:uncharacterized protein LOC122887138 [Siniperca chuatsi]XP_044076011.1 uncharacterized protein LOC122887138 [Siniperca chuatsi]XP_044076012.1 uncharacterized protein LOC122887138 [Siniperca chuatsi]XP_044076014.1 uncharacterized protein LOC122887138 [Siniperca chuatsi]